jgi:hypothetical protein
MLSSRSSILKVSLTALLATLLIAIALPTISSATTSSYPTEPLYITFSPNPLYAHPGTTPGVLIEGTNKGTQTFTVTSCFLYFRLGTSGPWTKIKTCFSSQAHFPYVIKPGSTDQALIFGKVDTKFPAITLQYMLIAFGKYGNTFPVYSHPGILTVHIT